MADYNESGYNEFLSREVMGSNKELDPLSADQFSDQTSGSRIQGGVIESNDGKTIIDLEAGLFRVNDGSQDIVQLGKLPDGTVGILIKDKNGNTLLQFTGDINLIQSPNQNFQADFNEERILAKDEGGTPRALFGKGNF